MYNFPDHLLLIPWKKLFPQHLFARKFLFPDCLFLISQKFLFPLRLLARNFLFPHHLFLYHGNFYSPDIYLLETFYSLIIFFISWKFLFPIRLLPRNFLFPDHLFSISRKILFPLHLFAEIFILWSSFFNIMEIFIPPTSICCNIYSLIIFFQYHGNFYSPLRLFATIQYCCIVVLWPSSYATFQWGHFHHHDEVMPSLSQQQQNCDIFISEYMCLLIPYTSFLVWFVLNWCTNAIIIMVN